jgi:O-acetylhomoserine/O-acetylserine sulfhydrylase-like pyridoxal-dependent enzyme
MCGFRREGKSPRLEATGIRGSLGLEDNRGIIADLEDAVPVA